MLVSLADMKAFLDIDPMDTTQDVFLTLQLNIISETIESYCGRKFLQGNYTQYYYLDEMGNTEEVQAYHYPVVSVSSILENDTALTDSYRIEKEIGLFIREKRLWLQSSFVSWSVVPKLTIAYSAGYAAIPYAIQYVVTSWVQEKYNRKSAGIDLNFGSDVQKVSIPGALSIDFDYTLTNNDRSNAFGNIIGNYVNVLDPYRSERRIIGKLGRTYVQ